MKKILQQNRPLIGTGIFSSDQFIAKKIFQCKPDWLWICLEHSPYSLETIAPIAIDARLNGIMPIIRVGWNHPDLIKRAYDIGGNAIGVYDYREKRRVFVNQQGYKVETNNNFRQKTEYVLVK